MARASSRSTSTTEAANGVELFERCEPDDPAFFYGGASISHRAAGDAAHALASALIAELDLRPGDRVGLMLQNVPEMVIAIHAVWLAGGIVTTVNPMYKERELEHQLSDAGARIVVCLESLAAVVERVRTVTPVEHVVTVAEPAAVGAFAARPLADLVAAHAGARVDPATPAPGDPAFLTYTSGTTGVPKGAINTHGAVVYSARTMARWYGLGRDDVVVALAPLFHITGLICHVATARACGAPLALGYRFEAGAMLGLIERWRGTFAVGPLTAFVAMLEHPSFAERDISSLRTIMSGGAPVYPAVAERWERATGTYVHNGYGLTEGTAGVVLVPLGERAPIDPASGALAVGVPIAGTEARIGENGEILVRGPGVTAGYWERPDETAHLLRDGWLHTGDVGVRDDDGWFYVVDRLKDVIISSGYKVWPREVEDALLRHPAVEEVCVVGAADDYRGERVKAFVTLRAGVDVTPAELIAHCRVSLAVYKAPREVVVLHEIPKTLSGKALRRELRDR